MPNFYNQYQNPFLYQQMPQVQPQQQPQSQTGGFISVRSELEARNYPVAPGSCMMFKIEGQPTVIEKSMGFSQFEAPHIDVYELVKKQSAPQDQKEIELDWRSEINSVRQEIDNLKEEIQTLKSKPRTSGKKKEVEELKDDPE